MEERERKTKLPEALRECFSAIVSLISFWAMAVYWNVAFGELDFVPILGFGAALSWVVFLHAEVIGVIIMSMMIRRLRAEARAEAWAEMMTQARAEARAELEKARAEARDEVEKARAEAMNDMLEEARARARAEARARGRAEARAEVMAEARAEAMAEAREARQIIRDLERQLREARNGEGANGA